VIPRYTRPELEKIWTDDHRYALWTRIEVAVCRALAARGDIPREALAAIESRARVDAARVAEIEAEVHHDVNAYLDALAEQVGPASRYVHLGLTSSDVTDTALALQLCEATDLILAECDRVLAALRKRALEHRHTACVGRTHGIWAEPTTFGLKLLYAFDEMRRNRERLERGRSAVAVGQASGAVGTFAHLDPAIDTACCGWANRGVAIGDGKVFVGQLDGRLVALDQRSGSVEWSIQAERLHDGYTITVAPL